jgi:hypothetical protein
LKCQRFDRIFCERLHALCGGLVFRNCLSAAKQPLDRGRRNWTSMLDDTRILKITKQAKVCPSVSIRRIDLMPIRRIGFGLKADCSEYSLFWGVIEHMIGA